jgi:glycine/serine hydroxymethyltransferase
MKEAEMKIVANLINRAITNAENESELEKIHAEVNELCVSFPLPQ